MLAAFKYLDGDVYLFYARYVALSVTGERSRDKIAAAKRTGMWPGGSVCYGAELEAELAWPFRIVDERSWYQRASSLRDRQCA